MRGTSHRPVRLPASLRRWGGVAASVGAAGWRLPHRIWRRLRENPSFAWEARPGRGRWSRLPPAVRALVSIAAAGAAAAAPTALRWVVWARTPSVSLAAQNAELAAVFAVPLVAVWSRLLVAAGRIARDRQRGMVDALLLAGVTPSEMVTGKALAVLFPSMTAASLTFLIWLISPVLPDAAQVGWVQFRQSGRALTACLWADMLAASAAATFAGLAISAGCRSARSALVVAGCLGALPLTLGVAFLSGPFAVSFWLSGNAQPVGAGTHAAFWVGCALLTCASFILAQALVSPIPAAVRLAPGVPVSARVTPRAAAAILLAVCAGLLCGLARPAASTVRAGARLAQDSRVLQLAEAHMLAGHYPQALAVLDSGIARGAGPAEREFWLWKGLCYRALGRHREGIDAAEHLLRLSTTPRETIDAHRTAARFCRKAGDPAQARRHYRAAVAVCDRLLRLATIPEQTIEAHEHAARLWRDAGDLAQARLRYHAALAVVTREVRRQAPAGVLPWSPTLQSLAGSLFEVGDRAGAIAALEMAAAAEESPPTGQGEDDRQDAATGESLGGLCLPLSEVRDSIAYLREHLDEAPRMGLRLSPPMPPPLEAPQSIRSPDVWEVEAGSGAARASLKAGDVVCAVDGVAATDRLGILRALKRHRPGETVAVVIERKGVRRTVPVRLSAPSPRGGWPPLGSDL